MKARIHLFEHEMTNSEFFKNLKQDGQPIYFRYDDVEDETKIPCDLLVVHKPTKYNIGDYFLIHNVYDDRYYIDMLKKIVKMSDFESTLDDVFIGDAGTVCPAMYVERIVATTYILENAQIPDIDYNFLCEYAYSYNTNNKIKDVEVETITNLDIHKKIKDNGINYFHLSDEDVLKVNNIINDGLQTPVVDDLDCISLTTLTNEPIKIYNDLPNTNNSNELIRLSETKVLVGDVIIEVSNVGVSMTLVDPSKFNVATVNMRQLQEIVGYILKTSRR